MGPASTVMVRNEIGMTTVGILDVERRPRTVAVGTFDGVHLGHRRVIEGCDTVLTFDPHPLRALRPERAPRMLADAGTKSRRLRALGVREVVVIPFDVSWAAMDAHRFVDELLVDRLGALVVSVGANFRFGARGLGDTGALAADPRFATSVAPLAEFDGGPVSSTRIRQLLAEGDVRSAATLLGRPHSLTLRSNPDGELAPGPDLCTPGPGRYTALINGSLTELRVSVHGGITASGSALSADAVCGTVEVEFLDRRT